MKKWLENYNDANVSLPEGFVGMGNNTKGRDYSPAWGGQFAMGGSVPGSVGFTYARTNSPAPSNGKYAKKTLASAQSGTKVDKEYLKNKKLYGAPDEDAIKNWFKEYYKSNFFKTNLQSNLLSSNYDTLSPEMIETIDNVNIKYGKNIGTGTDTSDIVTMGDPNADYWNQPKSEVFAHELAHLDQAKVLANQPRNMLLMLNRNKKDNRKDDAAELFKQLNNNTRRGADDKLVFPYISDFRRNLLYNFAHDEQAKSETYEHDSAIPEIRADIMALRYLASKKGIWDATKNKPDSFTSEMLNKLYQTKELNTPKVSYLDDGGTRSEPPSEEELKKGNIKNVAPPKSPGMMLQRLRARFSDEDLLYFMNKLAKNEDITPIDQAQNGTSIVGAGNKKLLYPNTQDPAFRDLYEGDLEPFNPKDYRAIQKQIGDYMRSDTYLDRLANYVSDKSFARRVALSRASALLNTELLKDKPYSAQYNPNQRGDIPAHSIQIEPTDTPSTVAHELGHSIFREQLNDSPGSTNGALGLNPLERAAILQGLDRENIYKVYNQREPGWDHPMSYYDPHYDTQGVKKEKGATSETYGDLTSIRKLVNDAGITKKFGDSLTPEMWKKALSDPKITKDPSFKRMKIKYKDEDIIRINNTVAQNDKSNELIPIAQDGKLVDPNSIIPKGTPLTLNTEVSETYDPFKPTWKGYSQSELAKKLEAIPVIAESTNDAKVMSKRDWKNKYKGNPYVNEEDYDTYKDIPNDYNVVLQRVKNEQQALLNWEKSKQQFLEDKAKKEKFINEYSAKKAGTDKYIADIANKYGYTPGEDVSAYKMLTNKMIKEANQAIDTGIGYPLDQDPGNEMTCINGICKIASNAGIDFSAMKGMTGVQQDPEGKYIPQYNPTWIKNDNYKKVGFRKLGPEESPEPGDLAQYSDADVAHHMELVLDKTPNGIVTFNNYQQTKESKPGAGRETRTFRPKSNQADEFASTAYFRLDPALVEKIQAKDPEYIKKLEAKKKFESSEDFKAYKEYQDFIKSNQKTYDEYKSFLDKLPKKQNGGEMKFYQQGLDWNPKSISKNGSVIKDDMGQWAHPGEITEIGSNQITMQGVNYPVLGISDTGDTKMMQPGKNYKFKGTKVTEYPKGGWLNKYK